MQFNWDGGALHPGSVAAGRFTINLGRPLRQVQRRSSRRSPCPTRISCQGFSIRQIQQHAELERLGDPDRRGVGRVRQRQDGRQGVRRPVRGGRGVLAAPRSSIRSTASSDTRGVDRPERRRKGSQSRRVARSSRKSAVGSANFGSPDTVDKQDPDLKRDKNWTYELTAQQELFPRVQVFGGYYRRHFFDLAWTDNLATANFVDADNPGDWIPFTYIGPCRPELSQRRRRSDHDVQPATRQDPGRQSEAGLPDERARRLPHLQRPRNRHQRQAAKAVRSRWPA